jgi:hypothetical protein
MCDGIRAGGPGPFRTRIQYNWDRMGRITDSDDGIRVRLGCTTLNPIDASETQPL